eukprot:CAMPEP_0171504884 /NCGR_PEP_ID=MMETSP0958-20121227/11867_1 /TAXON_ID=87120 /ORGANISM="Aurantiochytrium limacinum, Strain ATCCMYA-1381" /LENGTH=32 /DNA_ID= /DNA_START= /DNA_END= /DNA_ORIENTATION=
MKKEKVKKEKELGTRSRSEGHPQLDQLHSIAR